jgi:putative copper export protein
MDTAYFVSVFIHLIAASFWIGGMIFLPLVMLPGIKNNTEKRLILIKTGIKFRLYGMVALALLLITGLLNINYRGLPFTTDFFMQSGYGQLVLIKFALFTCIVFIYAAHDILHGRKAVGEMNKHEGERFKLMARWTGRIALLISLVMAYLGLIISRGG